MLQRALFRGGEHAHQEPILQDRKWKNLFKNSSEKSRSQLIHLHFEVNNYFPIHSNIFLHFN